jgi:hypothetical protein
MPLVIMSRRKTMYASSPYRGSGRVSFTDPSNTSSFSPSRTVMSPAPRGTSAAPLLAPPTPSEADTLEALRRGVQLRDEQRRVSVARHEVETQGIERTAAALSTAIDDADDVLTRQQYKADAVNRDIAAITAERTRQVSVKSVALAASQRATTDQRTSVTELQIQTQSLAESLAATRQELSRTQQLVEERHAAAAAAKRQLADTQHQHDTARGSFDAMVLVNRNERDRLEGRIADVSRSLAAVSEGIQRATLSNSTVETAHHERATTLRREVGAARAAIEHKAALLAATRQSQDEMSADHEEAARRRRATQEAEAEDHVAGQRATAMAQESDLAEVTRQHRVESEALADDERARVTHVSALLPALREEAAALFEAEMKLQDDVAAVKKEIVGTAAVQKRLAVAGEQHGELLHFNGQISDDVNVQRASVAECDKRIAVFRDAVAPLADVEGACIELAASIQKLTNDLADNEADHAVWRVQSQDSSAAFMEGVTQHQRDVSTTSALLTNEQRTIADDRERLQGELAVLNAEATSIDERRDDVVRRNKVLDQTLEHIARQRRAMADEMAIRRDAARAAAATLLSQLE